MDSLKLKPNQTFLVSKYNTQANYFKESELEKIIEELIDLDYNYKSGLIDLNIRELSKFIEIVSLDVLEDKNQWFDKMVWTVRYFDSSFALDCYMKSGKTDSRFYTEQQVVADYNVLDFYNSWSL